MITIIGGGLVGSLWAVLLRRKGVPVQVFEKRSDPRTVSLGAGRSINLVITSRGLYGLEQAGLLGKIQSLAVPVYGRMIHSLTGELALQPYGQKDEYNLSVSRDALNRFLISEAEAAGAKFYFEHELREISPHDRRASFSVGGVLKTTTYEILFGTDGAGSRTRKELARIYPGTFRESTEWLEADYKELTIPLGLDGRPALETKALHIWPRGDQMMMALANQDGSFTVTVYLPKRTFAPLKETKSIETFFRQQFSDAVPLMPNYLEEFQKNPQGELGTVRTSHWVFENSIALMGDAAHAIVPFFGQGMNSGFEDCTTLFELLGTSADWGTRLKAYEARQKPNADAIADMALENWTEMRDKVGDPYFLLRKKVEAALEERFPEIYKSRYGLVTYTLVPYALAQKVGGLQDRILTELTQDLKSVADLSWEKAKRLLDSELTPFLSAHGVRVQKYRPF